ncbi:DUF4183 domain-containing protein [Filibacter tadaridae]|uniref:DUF4183 domain-containing protein n=1 Tax=Filibacter tadaridae TaxID=2483811 RepID=A0A3P5XJV7_9BACL|nr:DUF4183 domain-containing protein [Filibacter tadaridae]VDC28898.1 hypothetical protein FILTAD_01892 [Filibacter tadaridae]
MLSSPLLLAPTPPTSEIRIVPPRAVTIQEYYTESDGRKKIFTEKDGVAGYGEQKIVDPSEVSYTNLFINGVLQLRTHYEIQQGKLILNTVDAPLRGAPIILQMIKF